MTNTIANHLQYPIQRNVRETNGLETAATNILRLTNVKKLTDRESEVAALLSEKVGLNKTALKFWMDTNSDSLVIDPRKRLRRRPNDSFLEINSLFGFLQ